MDFFRVMWPYLALSLLDMDIYVVKFHCEHHEISLQSEIIILKNEANIAIDIK